MNKRAAGAVRRHKERPVTPGNPAVRPKGRLLLIGGHEDKSGERLILRLIASRVGAGKLVVVTVAGTSPRASWHEYRDALRSVGVRHVHHLRIEARKDSGSARAMSILDDATGVFFTGGDQLKITTFVGGTAVFSRIYEIFVRGGLIAGTSAGAAAMSETMIVRGGEDESPRASGELELAAGLGFVKDVVVDQHFAERGRIGRLIGVVARNPRLLGIGIDEDTAVEVSPTGRLRVVGTGGVTILDGWTVSYTNVAAQDYGRTLSLLGATLHSLSQADGFDLRTRTPRPTAAELADEVMGITRGKRRRPRGRGRSTKKSR